MSTMSGATDLRAATRETSEVEISGPPQEASPTTRDAQDNEVCHDTLRADILRHIEHIGLASDNGNESVPISSKEEIRAGFGFTQRTVWRPESGYYDARPGTIRNFAQVLGVKLRELLKTKLQGDID